MSVSITDALSNNTWHLSQKMLSSYGFSYSAITNEAVFTTIIAGLASILGYYADKKYGILGNSLITSIALSVPLIILGATRNVYFMMTSLTLVTMTISFARPIFSAHINAQIDSSLRATTLSIQNLIVSIFASVYVFVLGLSTEIGKAFVLIGIISIPAYALILSKIRLHKRHLT